MPAPLASAESVESPLARLEPRPPFAKLTRPHGTPIWIRVSSIRAIRRPLDLERPDPPGARRSDIAIAGGPQAIQEDIEPATPIPLASGTKPALFA
jgi:hypothetical protein